MAIKLAPPQLPDGWELQLQRNGAVRIQTSSRERAANATIWWMLPLFGVTVPFSSCLGIALGPLWWLLMAVAPIAWIGHLFWVVGYDECLQLTSAGLELQPALFGVSLPRSIWREAEIEVVRPNERHWELRIIQGARYRVLHKTDSLGAVLGLASYLQDATSWPVHYDNGVRPLFPQVLDAASATFGPAHWWLLFQQPELYPGFADTLKDEGRRGRTLGELRRLEAEHPRLLQAVEEEDDDVRIAALELLTELGDRTVLPQARAFLAKSSMKIRRQVVITLGRLRDTEAVPVLCKLLEGDAELLLPAIAALGEIGDKRAVPALCAVLGSKRSESDSDLARSAVRSLGQIGDAEALPALGLALQQGAPVTREAAAAALGQIGDPSALPLLRLALEDREPVVRFSVAVALSKVSHPDSVPALETALQDHSPNVRVAAVASLAAIGDPAAIQALCEALENTEPLVRRDAAQRLGLLARREGVSPIQLRAAVPVLQRLSAPLSTERLEVKRACREALQRIEAGTGHLKRLPVPAAPSDLPSETLPRPSDAPVDPPEP